jgi:hypothetical protein
MTRLKRTRHPHARASWLAPLLVLAGVLVPVLASASLLVGPKTRVRGFDLAAQVLVGLEGDVSRTARQGYEVWYDELASGSLVAPNSGMSANKLAGDSVRDLIAAREAPALTEQTIQTFGGVRRVDVLKLGDELVSIESKVGRTSLGPRGGRVRQELARDWWSRRRAEGLPDSATKIDRVRWEFSRSDVTNKVGPTKPLQQKLDKLDFETVINE